MHTDTAQSFHSLGSFQVHSIGMTTLFPFASQDYVASWATVLYLSIGWKAAAVQQLQHDAAAAHTVAGGNVTYSNWESIAWTW